MNVYLDLLLLCVARWWNGLLARQPPRLVTLGDARMTPPHPTAVVEADQCGPIRFRSQRRSGREGRLECGRDAPLQETPHFKN
jgi:hypothetical protein